MIEPEDIHERLVNLGKEWAETNAAADLLEETKKSMISKLANECEEKSMAAKESYALGHKDYESHVNQMVDARRLANIAKVKYESAKVWVELLRTQSANERAANRVAI